jgi:hypothetical protein
VHQTQTKARFKFKGNETVNADYIDSIGNSLNFNCDLPWSRLNRALRLQWLAVTNTVTQQCEKDKQQIDLCNNYGPMVFVYMEI